MKCDQAVCNFERAVFVSALFTLTVGWLEVFLQATETCPNYEKKKKLVTTLVLHWVWSHVDDDDGAACRLAREPDADVCRFPRDCL